MECYYGEMRFWGNSHHEGYERRGLSKNDAATTNLVIAIEEDANGFGVGDVLLFEYAGGEGVMVIGGKDWDGSLDDDRAVIKVLVDEVDGAAGDLYTVVKSLLLRVKSGKGGEEGWMDVDDAVWELLHKPVGEQTHVSGQDDEVDVGGFEGGDDFLIVLLTRLTLTGDEKSVKSTLAGGFEAGGIGAIGDDYGDLCAGKFAGGDVIGDGNEVRTTPGKQDDEVFHCISPLRVPSCQ